MPSLTGYDVGFDSCEGDDAPLQGVYSGSTFAQGQAVTPEAHPPAASSNCAAGSSIRHGLLGKAHRHSSWPLILAAHKVLTTLLFLFLCVFLAVVTSSSSSTAMITTATTPTLASSPTSSASSSSGGGAANNVDSASQSSGQSSGALGSSSPAGVALCLAVLATVAGAFLA
jgi:hypothetical protein